VMTAHRRENLGKPMEDICRAMKRILDENADVRLVWPVHPNPKVREVAQAVFGGHERAILIEPLETEDMYHIASECYMLATESAGLQEISAFLDKPCVVLRNVTERPEGIDTGAMIIGGNSFDSVYASVNSVLNDKNLYGKMAAADNPFGDGKASERIAAAILHHFNISPERPKDFRIP